MIFIWLCTILMLSACFCYSIFTAFAIFIFNFCSFVTMICLIWLNSRLSSCLWLLALWSRSDKWFLIIRIWCSSSFFLVLLISLTYLSRTFSFSTPLSSESISWLRCFWVKIQSMQSTSLHSSQNTSKFLEGCTSQKYSWLDGVMIRLSGLNLLLSSSKFISNEVS